MKKRKILIALMLFCIALMLVFLFFMLKTESFNSYKYFSISFVLICIMFMYFFFVFRFRTSNLERMGYGKYDKKRMDYEEKIRQMQSAINVDDDHWRDNNCLALSGSSVFSSHDIDKICGMNRLPIKKGMAFMLMPFTDEAIVAYQACKSVMENLGYKLKKSDDDFVKGNLLEHIVSLIIEAELIIADLDGKNPNVYYELGISHALGKQTILISSYQPDQIPFNVMGNYIVFFKEEGDLREKLAEIVEKYINCELPK